MLILINLIFTIRPKTRKYKSKNYIRKYLDFNKKNNNEEVEIE